MSLIMEAIKKAQQKGEEGNQKNSWSGIGLRKEIPLKEKRKKWFWWSSLFLIGALSIWLIRTQPSSFFSTPFFLKPQAKVQTEKVPISPASLEAKKNLPKELKKQEAPPSSPSLAKAKEIEPPLLPLTLVAIQEPVRKQEIFTEKENFKEGARGDGQLKESQAEVKAKGEREAEQKNLPDEPLPKEEGKPFISSGGEPLTQEIKVKKIKEGSSLLQEAVKHFNAGTHFYRQRDLAQAIQSYKKALQLDPQFLEAYNNLALAYQEIGYLDQARDTLQTAIHIDPKYEKAWNNLGIILLLQNRYQEAKEVFQKSLLLNPQQVETHLNLGVLYRKEGELPKALESYQKALQISPLRGEIHYNLALIWEEMNNLPEAIHHYRSFLHLSARDYPALAAEVSRHLNHLGKQPKKQ